MLAFNEIPDEFVTWQLLIRRRGCSGYVIAGEYIGYESRQLVEIQLTLGQ